MSAIASGGIAAENESGRFRDGDLRGWLSDFVRPRYLALGVSLFLAMYVATKFVLVIFNATDPAERWPLDLTPFSLLNLPDIQLAFLSALATGANAALHYSIERKHRLWSLGLTAAMVASLILALRASTVNLDSVNIARFAVLATLLAMVSLDHVELLRSEAEPRGGFIESQLRALREATRDGVVAPRAVTRALRELQALVEGMPEEPTASTERVVPELSEGAPATPPPSAAAGSDEQYMRDLLTSMLDDLEEETAVRTGRTPQPRVPEPEEKAPSRQETPRSLVDRTASRFPRVRRSPAALLHEATNLADEGKLDKALKRLDMLADVDERFPGLWELAAEIYERMGEPQVAAECRRRAAASQTKDST